MLAQADVGDYPDTFRMAQDVLQEFGHLDILVNNAGINSDKTFAKMDHASWRKVLAHQPRRRLQLHQGLRRPDAQAGATGRVVNITSVIGQIGNFGQANYAASKAGVAAFTKSLAKELAGKGITVNAVAPGFIETEMVARHPRQGARATPRPDSRCSASGRPRRSRARSSTSSPPTATTSPAPSSRSTAAC